MSNAIVHMNDENFVNSIKSGITLVDFFAEWCGPCRMMAPILEELAQDFTGKAVVAKLDVDECQNTAQQYQITSVPTLILFKDGTELDRVVGLQDAESLKNMVNNAL